MKRCVAPLGSLALAACAGLTPPPAPSAPAPSPVAAAASAASAPARPPAPAPEPTPAEAAARASGELLAFADQARQLAGPDLVREISRLSDSPPAPRTTLQIALLLGLTRNPGDIARAQALLDGLLRSAAPDAAPLQPMARLLAARYVEQRRLEDQIDRLNAQARENQRRIEQLNEKLEALKAIERSLNTRPPGAAPGAKVQP